mgnify:CR=1 FL=1
MPVDSRNLGRLRRVANPRDVWTSEASDFTPWLAENIDVLADALGMTLTILGTEVPVGEFRLDLRAEDAEGRTVVIENQLERTDHHHLGQCLVYASGLDASTVIWVASSFREDFRRTLDWLNERTDLGVNFFGVQLGVVQIEDGPRAPVFEVVARPNDWQKTVKSAGTAAAGSRLSDTNAARQAFYAEVIADVVREVPAIRPPSPTSANWISFASGPFGYWALSITKDRRLRVEAYIDASEVVVNKTLFDEMHAGRAAWEQRVGIPLVWERLDDKRASRVAAYRTVDLEDEEERGAAQAWAAGTLRAMFDAMNDQLRRRASELKREHRLVAARDVAVEPDPIDEGTL